MEKSRLLGNCSLTSSPKALRDRLSKIQELKNSNVLQSIFAALGVQANIHLVGGSLRNLLSGQEIIDLDLAVEFAPETTLAKLEAAGIKVVATGLKHGTVTAVIDKQHIEITSFRKPIKQDFPLDPTNPDFLLQQDLTGRDFTINALAYSFNRDDLIDPLNGLADIQAGILRAVGVAENRFTEDPLRIMRAVRFGSAQGRKIQKETLSAAKNLKDLIKNVSPERVREELVKILLCQHPAQAFRTLNEIGLLEIIMPEIVPCVGMPQNEFHHLDVFEHTLAVIENCQIDQDEIEQTELLRLAALFHDIGKAYTLSVDAEGGRHFYKHELVSTDITNAVMQRLKFSHDQTRRVARLVNMHMRPIECGPSGVRRLLRDLENDFQVWLKFKRADAAATKVSMQVYQEKLNEFEVLVQKERERKQGSIFDNLAIDGNDLIKLGMPPGPKLGQILKLLNEMVIDQPELNQRQVLLDQASNLINASQQKN